MKPLVGSYNRGWFYHKEHRLWFIRVPNVEPLVKTNTYERGSYHCFDPNTFEIIRKVWPVICYSFIWLQLALIHSWHGTVLTNCGAFGVDAG